ncbi:H+-transporting ATP synthase subunit D [Thermoplasma volcanium GSS1]|uniref:A-type ATP synthase subunit D n=1 Tax=Thermoplasma volcanium (strain ATCC 51530 / DSM 4299 / JCM 9571 / NBRC 15438 / GSS1) TaxID=273116 RepID=AATD_THEVO|nr:V-type ATP synthase subunit D [Thermoplasma volcanium]Q97CP8.1 RecName: Full=V-type ATP synthase subunit D; AltName: Full=V-ATPase subunit D [Thermoplasma volcanium GSS1]BAB59195.1 H+-transporting ATP synthase subunit D [Thermoplasma volcanium GSS1]
MEIRPTRIELIRTRRRIKLARKGLDLLKMKRSALIYEFLQISRTIRGMRENLRREVEDALNTIRTAEILEGQVALERIANMSSDSTINVDSRNVMGVVIPTLNLTYNLSILSDVYRTISVPVAINDAIDRFQRLFLNLIQILEKENALRNLLIEIDKTKRRSNAIENILIPRLEYQAKMIKMMLDERERDTFTTLKTIKKKIEAGKDEE